MRMLRWALVLVFRDLAVLGWQRGAPVIGAAGGAESVLVRWPEGPGGA